MAVLPVASSRANGFTRQKHGTPIPTPAVAVRRPGPSLLMHAAQNPWASTGCVRPVGPLCRRDRPLTSCRAKLTADEAVDTREKHKIFDEVVIIVKSGDGGKGEIVESNRGRFVKNNKYKPGGNQPKQIWLPASDPADGADGADVVLVCDPAYDTLLHLHKRKSYAAPKGGNANPAVGSAGPKNNAAIKKSITPALEIPVPPGTVVKRKSSGQVLGELVQPGEWLLVAPGGRGGLGVRAPSREQKVNEHQRVEKLAREAGGEVVVVDDTNWKLDSKGLPGVQLSLHLLLRVVADVGIVGFPNAGKSSLLSRLTRASPEVAPYPFTTLMPNLGVMAAGQGPVLADLPGLIEGAHLGKGLGRMFLRHLRRTRVLLHVVDAAAADPATDYLAVREELRMYNPDYCNRPHVVALNKMDMEDAGALKEEITQEVLAVAGSLMQQHPGESSSPVAVVACSALTGEGVRELAAALQRAVGGPGSVVSEHDQDWAIDTQAGEGYTSGQSLGLEGLGNVPGGASEGGAAHVVAQDAQAVVGLADNEADEDEEPPPLDPTDPDAWLFKLTDEELLNLEISEEHDEVDAKTVNTA